MKISHIYDLIDQSPYDVSWGVWVTEGTLVALPSWSKRFQRMINNPADKPDLLGVYDNQVEVGYIEQDLVTWSKEIGNTWLDA
jgi:hypothetical protein